MEENNGKSKEFKIKGRKCREKRPKEKREGQKEVNV